MKGKEINLNEWVKKFDNREFVPNFREVQIGAGWYDWFCEDDALGPKTKKLAVKLKQIMKSDKIDCEKSFVFFKNNCPMVGTLYDDFRICNIKTGDVLLTITPSVGYDSTPKDLKAEVWGSINKFQNSLYSGPNWAGIKKWLVESKVVILNHVYSK